MPKQSQLHAWNLEPDQFPAKGTDEQRLGFLVRYAVLAPSVRNSQPWLFRIVDHTIELRVDRRRSMPVADPDERELVMSCGSALMNLRLALRRFGFAAELDVLPDGDDPSLLARVLLVDSRDVPPRDLELFDAIVRRRTNRRAFEDPGEVDEPLVDELTATAKAENAWLHPLSEPGRRRVIRIVTEADRTSFHDRRYRHELASWLTTNRSRRREGVPGYSLGVNGLASLALPMAVRTLDLGRLLARRDRRQLDTAALIAVLGTRGDGPADWLAAGQAQQAVVLRAQAAGLGSSFSRRALELPDHRDQVRALLGPDRGHPQQIIAFGRAPNAAATPRRPIEEVIENGRPHLAH